MDKRSRARTAVALPAAGVLALALGGCAVSAGGAATQSDERVVFAGFGGAVQDGEADAWLEPFEEATGITVVQDSPVDYTRIREMVRSDATIWDVADGGPDFPGGIGGGNEFLAQMDCEVIACSDFSGPFHAEAQGVPSYVYASVISYNTDAFAETAPTGLFDLWDTETFPGVRSVYTAFGMLGVLEVALLHSGVPRDELYPLDVERALAELDLIRDDLVFYTDVAEGVRQLASGEVVMSAAFNSDIVPARDNDGLPVDIAWGQQAQAVGAFLIPLDSPNPENAQELVAWMTSAENNGEISEFIPYGPANPEATPVGRYADDVPNAPGNELSGDLAPVYVDLTWWADHSTEVYERLAEWMSE